MDNLNASEVTSATLMRNTGDIECMMAKGVYHVICHDQDGNLKWEDDVNNLITYQGKGDMLTKYFKAGTNFTNWYCSLLTASSATASSTYATPLVTEVTSSSIAARLACSFGTASNATNNSTLAFGSTLNFSILNTVTIAGIMIVGATSGPVTTVTDTTATGGVLFSAGTFTGKACNAGDTLQVTYSVTV